MLGENLINARAADACVHSLVDWWRLAGVECTIAEEPVNWLRPKLPAATQAPGSAPAADAYPDDLDAFTAYLANEPTLPESGWPGQRVLPAGTKDATAMLIVDAPDSMAQAQNAHFNAETSRLIERMMAAAGLSMDQCYLASLSLSAPPPGAVDTSCAELLAKRMRHHIKLVRPKAVLLLGDKASRILLTINEDQTDKYLHFVNHLDGKVPAAAIIHPRLMMEQPAAKAVAWRSLRRLAKVWA